MIKELKCRAKPALDKDRIEELKQYMNEYYDGQFVYGNLIKDNWIVGEVVDSEEEWIALKYWIPVIPETVGRFIGRFDYYEGDIVSTEERDVLFEIVWDSFNCAFRFKNIRTNSYYEIDESLLRLEKIGNIHDNPELLEVIKNN